MQLNIHSFLGQIARVVNGVIQKNVELSHVEVCVW